MYPFYSNSIITVFFLNQSLSLSRESGALGSVLSGRFSSHYALYGPEQGDRVSRLLCSRSGAYQLQARAGSAAILSRFLALRT